VFDDLTGEDELVLDNAMTPAPEAPAPLAPIPPAPAAKAEPASKSLGGTLFERMSQLARGNAQRDDEDESEAGSSEFEVPRFLNRQNNQ